jgi:hypothetical protein
MPDFTPTADDEKRLKAMELDQLLSAGVETNKLFTGIEARKKLVNKILLAKLNEIGFQSGMSYIREADKVSVGIQTKAGVDKIVPEKLIAKGVAMDIIEFATEPGKDSEPFIVIRVPKKKGEKDAEA